MEKAMIQADTRESLDTPLRSTLSATDRILAGPGSKKLSNSSQADAPVEYGLDGKSNKRWERIFASLGGKNSAPCMQSLEVSIVQDACTKVHNCERPAPRASEQQFTNRRFSEDLPLADDARITIQGADRSASHSTHSTGMHQKKRVGAGLLASRSTDPSDTKSCQHTGGKLHQQNSVDLSSQPSDKQQPTLHLVPMAVQCPAYGEHLRYELSECKAFWSCNLHYRDWRQLFAASPFPKILPPNRLFVVRLFTSTLVLVTETFAAIHSYKDMGWPTYLYFTNTNCVLVTVYLLLMAAVSFHSLTVWKEPLCAKLPWSTEFMRTSDESATTAAGTQLASSTSTAGRPCGISCCHTFEEDQKAGVDKVYIAPTCLRSSVNVLDVRQKDCTGHEDGPHPRVSFVIQKTKELFFEIKKMWRAQGYKDLLADHNFCVRGIIFAPNPTYYPLPSENMPSAGGFDFCHRCRGLTEYTLGGQKQAPRSFVCFLWILHSVQLISSTTVSVAFFAMMRANGTAFTESWYTGWRHLALIIITVLHSVLLTRLPVPLRHVIFLYIICALYILLQVFVYVFDLPNGEGDNGCVYRVGTLERPLQFIFLILITLAFIAVVALFWWSVLRQRCADVSPPPSVSVPAAQVREREGCAQDADTQGPPEKHQRNWYVTRLLRSWDRCRMHERNNSIRDSRC